MADDGAPDGGASEGGAPDGGANDGGPPVPTYGGALARTEPYQTPTGLFGLTGTLMVLLLLAGALVSYVAFGLSAMCTDDFDASDCGAARAEAMVPLVLALIGSVCWGIGWSQRRTPVGIGWAWAGVGLALFGLFLVFG